MYQYMNFYYMLDNHSCIVLVLIVKSTLISVWCDVMWCDKKVIIENFILIEFDNRKKDIL